MKYLKKSMLVFTSVAIMLSFLFVHSACITWPWSKWEYTKNNDLKDSITMVKCRKEGTETLTSPLDSHTITRIGDKFSFVDSKKRSTGDL